jgi:phospholipid/cholesterol/gamma-HCH transport system permease protein
LIVAFIVIGRSATAITTELAGMRVNGQFDMLLVTGVNPHIYLFAPRIWGMVLSLFALNIFFIAFSVVGGFIMARVITYIDFYFLFQGFIQNIDIVDIIMLILKSIFFSMGIAVIAIREALKVDISSTEIPQAATRTVMQTIAYVLLVDIFFAGVIYL